MHPRFGFLCSLVLAGCATSCGSPPLSPRNPTPGVFHFKIASYNVEFSDWNDEATVRAVGGIDADVLCLQETTPSWQTVLEERFAKDYEYRLYRTKGERSAGGLAMLSRFPLAELRYIPGPNGWHPAWHVLVETPAGPIQVMNIHLRGILSGYPNEADAFLNVEEDHRVTIELFTETRDDYPTLAVGDFNESEEGPAVRYLERQGFENILPLFRPGQGTWRYPSVANQFDKALDHILFDENFAPLNAYVQRSGNSDHLPLIAHLEAATDWEATRRSAFGAGDQN